VYVYKICNNDVHDPFMRKYSNHITRKLDLNLMKEASKLLVGEHDFTSFASSKSKKKSNVRTIHSIEIQQNNDIIEIYVEGDGFLYNMVRIIAGTLIDAGLRRKSMNDIKYMIEAKDRSIASDTAPSKGLHLYKVKY
ncbi:MAG: tRNA pseudouridine synthase A, partial [Romboutsia sp.]|uniref:tRNA pseudouridine synthase A n=1 Tax=Romboutsia sp. TaxID=1965302 RepID=UPI003F4186E6